MWQGRATYPPSPLAGRDGVGYAANYALVFRQLRLISE